MYSDLFVYLFVNFFVVIIEWWINIFDILSFF